MPRQESTTNSFQHKNGSTEKQQANSAGDVVWITVGEDKISLTLPQQKLLFAAGVIQAKSPDKGLNRQILAEKIGVVPQRVSQIVEELAAKGVRVHGYVKLQEKRMQQATKRIAEQNAKSAKKAEKDAEKAARRDRALYLRRTEGLGDAEIARRENLHTPQQVNHLIKSDLDRPDIRLRKKKKSNEDLDLFDELVLKLYVYYDLTPREIAGPSRENKFAVARSFQRLRKKGLLKSGDELPPRKGRVKLDTTRLIQARSASNLSKMELTRQIGKGAGYVSALENGGVKNLPIELVAKIADILGVTTEELTATENTN